MYIVPWQTFSLKRLLITFGILELWRKNNLYGHYQEIQLEWMVNVAVNANTWLTDITSTIPNVHHP